MSLILTLANGAMIVLMTGLDADVCADKARLWSVPTPGEQRLSLPPQYHGVAVTKAECR